MRVPLVTDPEIIAGYLTDASNVLGRAEGLVRPRTASEVSDVVRHCQERGIPLTITAGRTSTTAAAVPEDGWLLSTEALARMGAISHDRATAQGGIRLGELQRHTEAAGRLYPPDPTSRHDCTLGASIACNASGARSFRYGPTRAWVEHLEVVLPTGELVHISRGDPIPEGWPVPEWTPPPVKCTSGYVSDSWLDLMVGNEGTLGVITEATVRLTDLPRFVGLLAFFPSRAAAVGFVREARTAARENPTGPLSPRCLEYYDHHCLSMAASRVGTVPAHARAALFCEQEIEEVGEDAHLEHWLMALEAHGAFVDDTMVADTAPRQADLHALRHAIPASVNEQIVHNRMPKVGTDLAVPDEALDEMFALYEASPLPHVLFGHVGDNHLHLNLLPRTADELREARAYYDLLARRAIDLGGTVSAEHGIGKLKRTHLEWALGPQVVRQFRALKAHVDPAGVLGRGNLIPDAASL